MIESSVTSNLGSKRKFYECNADLYSVQYKDVYRS
jgi:hypothetical protein